MKKCLFEAHRGVGTENPENTFRSLMAACMQGYDAIEVDPEVTSDGVAVLMHDCTINRTARNKDGSAIEKQIKVSQSTYKELSEYDYGVWFSPKFKGEGLVKLSDVMELSEQTGVHVKIDNKFARFDEKGKNAIYETVAAHPKANVGFTCFDADFAIELSKRFPDAAIHYDGDTSEEKLVKIATVVPKQKLYVWVPFESPATSWVSVPFANEELCGIIKKYAKLGLWIINSEDDFERCLAEFEPDIIETNGTVKPVKNKGLITDTHMHTHNSHDSTAEPFDMCEASVKKGVGVVCFTDHIDVEYVDTVDVFDVAERSVSDALEMRKKFDGKLKVLTGAEIGEYFWKPEVPERLLKMHDFDTVIGSVHSITLGGFTKPYSTIDMNKPQLEEYMRVYFEDVTKLLLTGNFDVLAHLTCPLRYINGRYSRHLDIHSFEPQITEILSLAIRRGIALEINTSCVGSDYDELMPEEWIIRKYRQLGGYLITLGSDAHTPERCANGYDRLFEVLENSGFKNIYYFENRYAVQCTLKSEEV